jgi:hypothetical protein
MEKISDGVECGLTVGELKIQEPPAPIPLLDVSQCS